MQIYENKRNCLHKKKNSTPTGLAWKTNMAAVSLFWNINMAAVTSCEKRSVERFNQRGQELCKFYWIKRKFLHKRKVLTPRGLLWENNMAAVSFFLDTNMADVTSCKNAL